MSLAKALVLFSLLLSAAALATPHLYNGHHHRAVAARVAQPQSVPVNASNDLSPRKRSLGKRCTHRTPPSSSAPSPTPAATVENAGAQPPSSQVDNTPSTTQDAPQYTPPPPASPSPSPSQSPSDPSSGNEPSYMIGTQSGDGTFYATGLGACGITNNDSDYICAVSHLLYDTFPGYDDVNPNTNPICGRQVVASYQGKSVTLTITDRCEGCQLTDLDMSPTAFSQLADLGVGRIHDMTWVWV